MCRVIKQANVMCAADVHVHNTHIPRTIKRAWRKIWFNVADMSPGNTALPVDALVPPNLGPDNVVLDNRETNVVLGAE